MTNLAYHQGSPEDKLIEECAELIQIIIKYKRFGKEATDPFTGIYYNNKDLIKKEMDDVVDAIEKLEQKLRSDTE